MFPGGGHDLVHRIDKFGLIAFRGNIAKNRQGKVVWPDENHILLRSAKSFVKQSG
jgi:hypothetical protein